MSRDTPFLISFRQSNNISLSRFCFNLARQILINLKEDPTSIYCTSLNTDILHGYSNQFCVILNDIFTDHTRSSKQLSILREVLSNSSFSVNTNRYKEPIFFNSKIIILNTSNFYPDIRSNFNYLVHHSNISFEYCCVIESFYKEVRPIVPPSFNRPDPESYYCEGVSYNPNKHICEKGEIANVTTDAYQRYISRRT